MSEFKEGDVVRRIKGSHMGMEIGDVATIRKKRNGEYSGTIYLNEYDGGHDSNYFKKVTSWRKKYEAKNDRIQK